jgi:hypothetical protein
MFIHNKYSLWACLYKTNNTCWPSTLYDHVIRISPTTTIWIKYGGDFWDHIFHILSTSLKNECEHNLWSYSEHCDIHLWSYSDTICSSITIIVEYCVHNAAYYVLICVPGICYTLQQLTYISLWGILVFIRRKSGNSLIDYVSQEVHFYVFCCNLNLGLVVLAITVILVLCHNTKTTWVMD